MSGYREILEQVRDGALSVDDALLTIKKKPFADIGATVLHYFGIAPAFEGESMLISSGEDGAVTPP